MATRITARVNGADEVRGLLWGLALASLAQIRRGKVRVPLFASGVRYEREPRGRERWQTAAETMELGVGDCEDLVAWRVAELWHAGERAEPHVYSPRPGLLHCVVKRADGTVECPSSRLGMRGGK